MSALQRLEPQAPLYVYQYVWEGVARFSHPLTWRRLLEAIRWWRGYEVPVLVVVQVRAGRRAPR